MQFNPDVTKQANKIYFINRNNVNNVPALIFNGSSIRTVRYHKHLGLILEYKLTFDIPEKKDLLFETLGVKICVDRKSHLLLDGLLIDWTNDLSAPGPRFENPRATSTCGCSTSFNVKQDLTLQENKPAWLG